MKLSDRIKLIYNGRITKIIDALNVKDICEKCAFFNKSILKENYRCYCEGSCIAATLHPELIDYINKELGFERTPVKLNGETQSFLLIIAGKNYRCECGCNVFHKPDDTDLNRYKCNSCGIESDTE